MTFNVEGAGNFPVTSEQWGAAWKATQAERRQPPTVEAWNERAKTFGNSDSPSNYTDRFIELAALNPGETVFDMGCGVGNLAIPFAQAGHRVLAADFSHVMLERLAQNAEGSVGSVGVNSRLSAVPEAKPSGAADNKAGVRDAEGVTSDTFGMLETKQLSWEDNWEAHGVAPESFDVCTASRSIATADLRQSILKLSAVARRRACITLAAGTSPQVDDQMLREIGLEPAPNFDYIYALAILAAEGFTPELTYITTNRWREFDSAAAAREKFISMTTHALPPAATPAEIARAQAGVDSWLAQNLTTTPAGRFTLKHPHESKWAFISWEK
jgi:SAM-dependent methyltransferase